VGGVDEQSLFPRIVPDTTYGRVYEVAEGVYFPSVSTICNYGMPTDEFLIKWYIEQSRGSYERHIKFNGEASEVGTYVHDTISDVLLEGKEISISSYPLDHIKGRGYYPTYQTSIYIKKALSSFVTWFNIHKPKIIAKETLLSCLDKVERGPKKGEYKYPFAGRCDLVAEINGELWLLDIKTSKAVENSYSMQCQLSIYKTLWDKTNEREIDRMGIIWAKKDFTMNTPPKSVHKTYEYDYDFPLVEDTYRMFKRFYKGYDKKIGVPKQRKKLPNTFKLEL
tara:strand:- start:5942 stop:6781 length:840 start_codon:yes stop_codon:yes gene_type:complete